MKTIKLITLTISLALTISGCAVKNTDSDAMKVAKHTANAPMYALVGTGMIIETAMIGAIVAPIALVNYTNEKLSTKDSIGAENE